MAALEKCEAPFMPGKIFLRAVLALLGARKLVSTAP